MEHRASTLALGIAGLVTLACAGSSVELDRSHFSENDALVLYRSQNTASARFWSDGHGQSNASHSLWIPVEFQGKTWHPSRVGNMHVSEVGMRWCGTIINPNEPTHSVCFTVGRDCRAVVDHDEGPWPGKYTSDDVSDLVLTSRGRLLKRVDGGSGTPSWSLLEGASWTLLVLEPTPVWLDESASHWVGLVKPRASAGPARPTAWTREGVPIEALPEVHSTHRHPVVPSPIDDRVIVATEQGVELWTPGAGTVALVAPTTTPENLPEKFGYTAVWAPDGEAVVFWTNRKAGRKKDPCTGIHHPIRQPHVVDLATGSVGLVYESAATPATAVWGPAWLAQCSAAWDPR